MLGGFWFGQPQQRLSQAQIYGEPPIAAQRRFIFSQQSPEERFSLLVIVQAQVEVSQLLIGGHTFGRFAVGFQQLVGQFVLVRSADKQPGNNPV